MDFATLIAQRQSCRSYDPRRTVSQEDLGKCLEAARMAPSACNAQPYHITVCQGESAKRTARATTGMGMNSFTKIKPPHIHLYKYIYEEENGFMNVPGIGKEYFSRGTLPLRKKRNSTKLETKQVSSYLAKCWRFLRAALQNMVSALLILSISYSGG